MQAATGEPADQLYANYFASFGADPPSAVTPDPLLPSNVRKPDGSLASGAPQAGDGATARPADTAPSPSGDFQCQDQQALPLSAGDCLRIGQPDRADASW